MSNHLLIDTDVLCYQFAFRNTDTFSWDGENTHEVTQPKLAVAEVRSFINELLEKFDASEAYLILSDRHANFRKDLEPTYKLDRAGKPKPTLWHTIREYIESGDHGFPVRELPRLEGDDVLGIMATHPKRGDDAIVVTIDKDMATVPCRVHFFNHEEKKQPPGGYHVISGYQGARFHLTQVLTGDPVDGYKGCPGVGPVGAEKLAAECRDLTDFWEAIVQTYVSKGLEEKDALLQARLAYILQHGDYTRGGKIRLWKPKRLTGVSP